MADGTLVDVVISIRHITGQILSDIDSITVNGVPAPGEYRGVVHSQFLRLLADSFTVLIAQKTAPGYHLDGIIITDDETIIETAFAP